MKRGILVISVFFAVFLISQVYALDYNETRSYNDIYNNPTVKFSLASDVSVKYAIEILSSIASPVGYIGTEWAPRCGTSFLTRNKGIDQCMPSDAWVRLSFEDENGRKFTSSEFYVPANATGNLVILVYKNGVSQWTIGQTDSLIQYFPKEAGDCLFVASDGDKDPCFKSFADQGADAQKTCSAESTSKNEYAHILTPFMENSRDQCFYIFSLKLKDPSLCNQMGSKDSQDSCYYIIHKKYDFKYYFVWFFINILPIILYLGLFFVLVKKVKSPLLKYPLLGLFIAEVLIGYLRYFAHFLINPISRVAVYLIGSGLFSSIEMYSNQFLIGLPCSILTRCSGEGCMVCLYLWPLPLILFGLVGLIIGLIIRKKKSTQGST